MSDFAYEIDINGTKYINDTVLKINIDKKIPMVGENLSADRCIIVLDNTELSDGTLRYTLNQTTFKIYDNVASQYIQDQDIYVNVNSIRQFTGKCNEPKLNIKNKTLEITCRGLWAETEKITSTQSLAYFDKTFDYILKHC